MPLKYRIINGVQSIVAGTYMPVYNYHYTTVPVYVCYMICYKTRRTSPSLLTPHSSAPRVAAAHK